MHSFFYTALDKFVDIVQLKVYDGVLVEKLQVLLKQGLCITINSDDPAYFGGHVNANYAFLAEMLGLAAEEIYELHKNSFVASFLDEKVRAAHLSSLDHVFKQFLDGTVDKVAH